MFDNDEAGADAGTEGRIDIAEEAGRDTDGAAEIEVGTGGRAVAVDLVVVVVDWIDKP